MKPSYTTEYARLVYDNVKAKNLSVKDAAEMFNVPTEAVEHWLAFFASHPKAFTSPTRPKGKKGPTIKYAGNARERSCAAQQWAYHKQVGAPHNISYELGPLAFWNHSVPKATEVSSTPKVRKVKPVGFWKRVWRALGF